MPRVTSDLILVDTNVLVYSLDPADHAKQRRAIDVLDELAIGDLGAVSVQCLTESFNAITRNIAQPMSSSQAVAHVADFVTVFAVLDLTGEAVVEGCRAVDEWQTSIWDALIWSVARVNGILTILTEDIQHRSTISGIHYINPFVDDLNLAALLARNRGP